MRTVIARLPGGVLIETLVAAGGAGRSHSRYHVSGGHAGDLDFDTVTALNEYVISLHTTRGR